MVKAFAIKLNEILVEIVSNTHNAFVQGEHIVDFIHFVDDSDEEEKLKDICTITSFRILMT